MRTPNDVLSADAARFLLSIDFEKEHKKRLLDLAERSETGTLTSQEQAEFDSYLHIGNFLAIMQSKARLALNPRDSRAS